VCEQLTTNVTETCLLSQGQCTELSWRQCICHGDMLIAKGQGTELLRRQCMTRFQLIRFAVWSWSTTPQVAPEFSRPRTNERPTIVWYVSIFHKIQRDSNPTCARCMVPDIPEKPSANPTQKQFPSWQTDSHSVSARGLLRA
jgi:hypothetical protein